ncbi:hypothetical protein, partial [Chryseobacterium indologenes]|uniref:hypothetical protein n=1 Tax=Chryseobacterium indologenes TaxID=253 RepID=UPI0019D3B0DB
MIIKVYLLPFRHPNESTFSGVFPVILFSSSFHGVFPFMLRGKAAMGDREDHWCINQKKSLTHCCMRLSNNIKTGGGLL